MIKCITEIFCILLFGDRRMLLFAALLFRTWTMFAAFATLTALTTVAPTTVGAFATFALYVVCGLLDEHTVGELVFAGLGVNLQKFHLNVVTFLDASLLDGLKAFPVDFRDVEQSVLAGHDFNEATIGHDGAHDTVVHLANFRDGHDGTDFGNGSIDRLRVGIADLHLAHAVGLVDGDGGTGILLHLLDAFSARADNGTNEFLRNVKCFDAGHLGLHLCT